VGEICRGIRNKVEIMGRGIMERWILCNYSGLKASENDLKVCTRARRREQDNIFR